MSARILVVDDETVFAEAMATRLSRDGHDCRTAGTLAEGRACLDRSAAWDADVVLLDMRIDDVDASQAPDEPPR